MKIDKRVARRYETSDEDGRLWRPGFGTLTRLRTWDVFQRILADRGRLVDVGGGPGTHAAHLARQGHDVLLLDPVPRHAELAAARSRSQPDTPFGVGLAEARGLPLHDGTVDAALLMGPLYHLFARADRIAALRESARVLRPGGTVVAEIITRHAWILDATRKDLLGTDGIWTDFDWNLRSGLTGDPGHLPPGGFWAYLHHPVELRDELGDAGYDDIRLVAVEGFAWLLGDLEHRLADPAGAADLLRAVRLVEEEPAMLGVSSHVIGVARRP